MPGRRPPSSASVDFDLAAKLLEDEWQFVSDAAATNPEVEFVAEADLRADICDSVNHRQVTYRFCLPIQLLGKLVNPGIDCLRLQKRKDDPDDVTGWDARSLGSGVVAPFNRRQEGVLGTSGDPYVSNPMRIPRMQRDDPSKKDIKGWNRLVHVLEQVEAKRDPDFSRGIFRQVLLEILRRQRLLRFSYPIPPRVSLEDTLRISREFLRQRSGGDRALALAAALFESIGLHFGIFRDVRRGKINTTDEASDQVADLECCDDGGRVVLAVEVKDRVLTLADVEDTLRKSRKRNVRDVLLSVPATRESDETAVKDRIVKAFSAGQNLYRFDFFEIASPILALGGEGIRNSFLRKVGENLDTWKTQPAHRQAWKDLLETL